MLRADDAPSAVTAIDAGVGPPPRPEVVMSDPRPQVDASDCTVRGWRCTDCGYPLAVSRPMCPLCRGRLGDARFGPSGTVFAATVIRIAVGDRVPPYALVYVDLDDGPRILAHIAGDGTAADVPGVGARVAVHGTSGAGDVVVAVTR